MFALLGRFGFGMLLCWVVGIGVCLLYIFGLFINLLVFSLFCFGWFVIIAFDLLYLYFGGFCLGLWLLVLCGLIKVAFDLWFCCWWYLGLVLIADFWCLNLVFGRPTCLVCFCVLIDVCVTCGCFGWIVGYCWLFFATFLIVLMIGCGDVWFRDLQTVVLLVGNLLVVFYLAWISDATGSVFSVFCLVACCVLICLGLLFVL